MCVFVCFVCLFIDTVFILPIALYSVLILSTCQGMDGRISLLENSMINMCRFISTVGPSNVCAQLLEA